MAEPFIFIGTHRVKPGRLEDFKDYFAKFCSNTVEPNEPRLLSFQGYGDDSDQITVVQVHPDSDSMLTHLSLIGEHVEAAFREYLEPESSYQIYGVPRGGIVAMVEQLSADRHVALTVKEPFTGFQHLPDT
jgi:hypothetical protein